MMFKVFSDPMLHHEKKELHIREMKECLNDWIHACDHVIETLGEWTGHKSDLKELDGLQFFAPLIRDLSECALRTLSQASSSDECLVNSYEHCRMQHGRIFMVNVLNESLSYKRHCVIHLQE